MVTRKQVTKQKKVDRSSKRFSKASLFIMTISAVIVLIIGTVVVVRYQQTEKWANSKLDGKMADVPPEFAKNTYKAETLKDINSLAAVNEMLTQVKKDNGLTEKTIDKARETLSKSKSILKKYKISSGKSKESQDDLSLYIDVYEIEKSAYDYPDAKKLSNLISKVETRRLAKNESSDTAILKRLSTIAERYQELNEFVDSALPKLGTVKGSVLIARTDLSQQTITSMLAEITNKKLADFPKIKNLAKLLSSSFMDSVLESNAALSDYNKWQDALARYNSLSKVQYVDPESIKTFADAKRIGAQIIGYEESDGLEVMDESPVTSVSVDGQALSDGQYFRRGSSVTVTINPTYKEAPRVEEPEIEEPEEEPEQPETPTPDSGSESNPIGPLLPNKDGQSNSESESSRVE